jgi:hypothetical protein
MAKKKIEDGRSAIERFYDRQVRELADQASEEAREQIEAAFAEPPKDADDVDPWFLANFHQPPVSHDTQLFNRLAAMKAQLREIAGGGARNDLV